MQLVSDIDDLRTFTGARRSADAIASVLIPVLAPALGLVIVAHRHPRASACSLVKTVIEIAFVMSEIAICG